jgi:hypothetical protein
VIKLNLHSGVEHEATMSGMEGDMISRDEMGRREENSIRDALGRQSRGIVRMCLKRRRRHC